MVEVHRVEVFKVKDEGNLGTDLSDLIFELLISPHINVITDNGAVLFTASLFVKKGYLYVQINTIDQDYAKNNNITLDNFEETKPGIFRFPFPMS